MSQERTKRPLTVSLAGYGCISTSLFFILFIIGAVVLVYTLVPGTNLQRTPGTSMAPVLFALLTLPIFAALTIFMWSLSAVVGVGLLRRWRWCWYAALALAAGVCISIPLLIPIAIVAFVLLLLKSTRDHLLTQTPVVE